jgi:hypothetical protein
MKKVINDNIYRASAVSIFSFLKIGLHEFLEFTPS